jgi:hypothetical protein
MFAPGTELPSSDDVTLPVTTRSWANAPRVKHTSSSDKHLRAYRYNLIIIELILGLEIRFKKNNLSKIVV